MDVGEFFELQAVATQINVKGARVPCNEKLCSNADSHSLDEANDSLKSL